MTDRKRKESERCLLCDTTGVRLTRGLCAAHHKQYLRARKAASDPDAFDQHLISAGMLMPSKQGKRLAPGENAFEAALAEFEGLPSPEAAHHKAKKAARKPADEAAADLAGQAAEVQQDKGEKAGQGAGRKKRGGKR